MLSIREFKRSLAIGLSILLTALAVTIVRADAANLAGSTETAPSPHMDGAVF